MAEMVDMKRDEPKEADEVCMSGSPDPYPYGLCLHLNTEELEKLGIKDLPKVGDEYHIMAAGRVTSVSQSASETKEGADESSSMAVQIMYLQLVPEAAHKGEENESAAAENRERVVTERGKAVVRTALG